MNIIEETSQDIQQKASGRWVPPLLYRSNGRKNARYSDMVQRNNRLIQSVMNRRPIGRRKIA